MDIPEQNQCSLPSTAFYSQHHWGGIFSQSKIVNPESQKPLFYPTTADFLKKAGKTENFSCNLGRQYDIIIVRKAGSNCRNIIIFCSHHNVNLYHTEPAYESWLFLILLLRNLAAEEKVKCAKLLEFSVITCCGQPHYSPYAQI